MGVGVKSSPIFLCIKGLIKRMNNIDLNYLIDNEIIDLPNIQSIIEMQKRQELLNNHPYKIWCGSNGKWYTYLPDETKGRVLKKKSTKEDIEDVVIKYQESVMSNPTIEELFDEWNDHRRDIGRIAKSSHTRLRQVFDRHFKEFGKRRIASVKENEWIDFLEAQVFEHNLSSKAFASLKSITKGMLKWAKRQGIIAYSPELMLTELDLSDNVFTKKIKEDYEEVFDEDETQKMLSYLTGNRDIRNDGITLLFVSGMRVGELVGIKPQDINLNSNTVKIRRTETRFKDGDETIYTIKEYPKTQAGVREIVIPSSYSWLLKELYVKSRGQEFVFEENGKRITTLLIRKRIYSICKKTGVYKKSPHKIRATYDTILLDNGVDKRTVKDQMGHSDIAVSEKNYHRNRKSIKNKAVIIDGIADFRTA